LNLARNLHKEIMNPLTVSYPLRISTPKEEGVMEISKALKWQVLMDACEMAELMESLGSFDIFGVSGVVGPDHGRLEKKTFLLAYENYLSSLKEGILPEEKTHRPFFSSIWSQEKSILYAAKVGEERFLIKALKPVIQLQLHHLSYSHVDGKFHPMVQAKDSITWGVQFSYPHIFQHPKTKEFSKVVNSPEFPNTALFLALGRWLRQNTLPTPIAPLEKPGSRIILPVRLGKHCFSWINNHPRLVEKAFQVMNYVD
jgi:hypothetical protein